MNPSKNWKGKMCWHMVGDLGKMEAGMGQTFGIQRTCSSTEQKNVHRLSVSYRTYVPPPQLMVLFYHSFCTMTGRFLSFFVWPLFLSTICIRKYCVLCNIIRPIVDWHSRSQKTTEQVQWSSAAFNY